MFRTSSCIYTRREANRVSSISSILLRMHSAIPYHTIPYHAMPCRVLGRVVRCKIRADLQVGDFRPCSRARVAPSVKRPPPDTLHCRACGVRLNFNIATLHLPLAVRPMLVRISLIINNFALKLGVALCRKPTEHSRGRSLGLVHLGIRNGYNGTPTGCHR